MTDRFGVRSAKILFFNLLVLIVAKSLAAGHSPTIALGRATYGGNGCPQGTVSPGLGVAAKTLHVKFDEFEAEAGGSYGKRRTRKTCNLAVPIQVPEGWSFSIFKIDYRGFIELPAGANAQYHVDYFFAGSRGPSFKKTFNARRARISDDFILSNKLRGSAQSYSRCGEDVNLRINTQISVKTNRQKEEALLTLNSADLAAGMVFHLAWKRCASGQPMKGTYADRQKTEEKMKSTTSYFQINPYKLLAFVAAVAAASAVAVSLKFVKFQNSQREARLRDIASERDMLGRLLVTQGAARGQVDIDFHDMMSKTLHDLVRQQNNVNMWGELKAFSGLTR